MESALVYKRGLTKDEIINKIKNLGYEVKERNLGLSADATLNISELRLLRKQDEYVISLLDYRGDDFVEKSAFSNPDNLKKLSQMNKQRVEEIVNGPDSLGTGSLIVLAGEFYFAKRMEEIAKSIEGLIIFGNYENLSNSNVKAY